MSKGKIDYASYIAGRLPRTCEITRCNDYVTLWWSSGVYSVGDIASIADVDPSMIGSRLGKLFLTIPNEIASRLDYDPPHVTADRKIAMAQALSAKLTADKRDDLIHYADDMPFESAWRAYAGMVEGGECTMQDLQCIKPELYRMVESYFELLSTAKKQFGTNNVKMSKPLAERLKPREHFGTRPVTMAQAEAEAEAETSVLEWLACNDYQIIDDSRTSIYRCGLIDVYHEANTWQIVVHTNSRARLIDFSMTFSPRTPARIIIDALKSAQSHTASI